jgi:hypothetical protein
VKSLSLKHFSKFFAKIKSMAEIPERIKYRAETLRYIGFALMSSFATTVLMIFTDKDYLFQKLNLILLPVSFILCVIGWQFLDRGLYLVDKHSVKGIGYE